MFPLDLFAGKALHRRTTASDFFLNQPDRISECTHKAEGDKYNFPLKAKYDKDNRTLEGVSAYYEEPDLGEDLFNAQVKAEGDDKPDPAPAPELAQEEGQLMEPPMDAPGLAGP